MIDYNSFKAGVSSIADALLLTNKSSLENFGTMLYHEVSKFSNDEIMNQSVDYIKHNFEIFPKYKQWIEVMKKFGYPIIKTSVSGRCLHGLCDNDGYVYAVSPDGKDVVCRCSCDLGSTRKYVVGKDEKGRDYIHNQWNNNLKLQGYRLWNYNTDEGLKVIDDLDAERKEALASLKLLRLSVGNYGN